MSDTQRWLLIAICVLGIVALVAWARNDPGVGGRQPDPPTTSHVTATATTVTATTEATTTGGTEGG